jgi:hypothetical protein
MRVYKLCLNTRSQTPAFTTFFFQNIGVKLLTQAFSCDCMRSENRDIFAKTFRIEIVLSKVLKSGMDKTNW